MMIAAQTRISSFGQEGRKPPQNLNCGSPEAEDVEAAAVKAFCISMPWSKGDLESYDHFVKNTIDPTKNLCEEWFKSYQNLPKICIILKILLNSIILTLFLDIKI